MLSEVEAGGFDRWVRRELVKFTAEMFEDLDTRVKKLEGR